MKKLKVEIEIHPQSSMREIAEVLRVAANALSPLAVDAYTINGPTGKGMRLGDDCIIRLAVQKPAEAVCLNYVGRVDHGDVGTKLFCLGDLVDADDLSLTTDLELSVQLVTENTNGQLAARVRLEKTP